MFIWVISDLGNIRYSHHHRCMLHGFDVYLCVLHAALVYSIIHAEIPSNVRIPSLKPKASCLYMLNAHYYRAYALLVTQTSRVSTQPSLINIHLHQDIVHVITVTIDAATKPLPYRNPTYRFRRFSICHNALGYINPKTEPPLEPHVYMYNCKLMPLRYR